MKNMLGKNKYVKRKKIVISITYHNIEKHVFNNMKDIEDGEDNGKQASNHVKIVKMSIGGKNVWRTFL